MEIEELLKIMLWIALGVIIFTALTFWLKSLGVIT